MDDRRVQLIDVAKRLTSGLGPLAANPFEGVPRMEEIARWLQGPLLRDDAEAAEFVEAAFAWIPLEEFRRVAAKYPEGDDVRTFLEHYHAHGHLRPATPCAVCTPVLDNADPLPSWLKVGARPEAQDTTIGDLARLERDHVHHRLVGHVRDRLDQGPPRIVEYGGLVNPECEEALPRDVSEILGLPEGSTFGAAAATGAWWRAGSEQRTREHERGEPESKKREKSKKKKKKKSKKSTG